MTKRFVIYILFVLVSVLSLRGERGISLPTMESPAAGYYYSDSTSSYFSVGYISDRMADNYISETGDAVSAFGVNAGSFYIMDSKTRLSGYASYRNSVRRNSIWNENADYELIYPYVSGDSIGGDVNCEQYMFSGTYSRMTGRWITGATLKYRAQIEHRTVDPRPRNVVSDIDLSLAAGYKYSRYLISGRVLLNSYSQKSSISFVSDLGSSSIYHMTGMGMDYIRFAGPNTSVNYKGFGYGAGIDLVREDRKGWAMSAVYSVRNIDKIMTSLNYLTLNELNIQSLVAGLSYASVSTGVLGYAVRIDGNYSDRQGKDNIFGDPTSNTYPRLASQSQYSSRSAGMQARADLSYDMRKYSFIVSPLGGMNDFSELHKESGREMNVTNMYGGAELKFRATGSKTSFDVRGGYRYSTTPESSVDLRGLDSRSSRYIALIRNYNYRSDSFDELTLGVGCKINIKNKTKFTLSGSVLNRNYSLSGNAMAFEISTGLEF